MSKVQLLDTVTINKIAAGEVVERPASVVKELVENAIDANATRIEIEILDGGKSLIRVTDNGVGMAMEDAALSLRRHATSKLSSVEDLLSIGTLGFRGEALPAIASVSKLTLQTRTADSEIGVRIKVDGGKIADSCDIGCKIGTTILVENLFFNVPARLNFMKVNSAEAGRIHDVIVKLALSCPNISFKFINSNRAVLTTPGNGNLIDTLTAIYGVELSRSLFNVKLSSGDFTISGYISKPNFLTSWRSRQTILINGRVITENRTIMKAIEEAYKSLVSKDGHPFAILKIDVPQNFIDVNVHPRKLEVRFQDDGEVYSSVYRAVREAISERHINGDLRKVAAPPDKPHYSPLNLDEYFGNGDKNSTSTNDFIIDPTADKPALTIDELREKLGSKEQDVESSDENFFSDEENLTTEKNSDAENISTAEKNFDDVQNFSDGEKNSDDESKQIELESFAPKNPSLENFRAIGQVGLCYVIAQSDSELYVIDQHAAHERILFDKFSSYADEVPAQILLIHQNLKFDERETATIENNLELFAKLGFSMELSGENEFRLTSVPVDAANADAGSMLREIISSLPESDSPAQIDDARRAEIAANIRSNFIAIASCRGAIKAGKRLSLQEMDSLLKNLSRTPHPYTCPHGRPTIIKFSSGDFAKMFHRG